MEKISPHYCLSDILTQMQSVPDMNITVSARSVIRAAEMSQDGTLAVVESLTRQNLYKSMTTHANHRVWQDVYHGEWCNTALYIKFQRTGEYFVVSFKEL